MPADHHRMARASAVARSAAATKRADDLAHVVAELRAAGATSLRSLAAQLTEAGHPPPRAARWSAMAVKRLLDRSRREVDINLPTR